MDNNATYTMKLGKEFYLYSEKLLSQWITLPDGISRFFSYEIFGNSIYQWTFATVTFILFFILRNQLTRLVQYLLNRASERIDSNIATPIFNTIHKPIKWIILLLGFNVSVSALDFNIEINNLLVNLSHSFRVFLVVWILFLIVDLLHSSSKIFLKDHDNQSFHNFMQLTKRFIKIVMVIVAVIFFLSIWGYNVTGLLASLGLVGMAVALAAQDTTKNIFGALMIFTDMPFKVGDWIQTPEVEGNIEEIGMRSTKVRTFTDALVSVPNGVLANASIVNWSAMTRRRVKMTLGLTYSTTPDQMQNILNEMRELLKNDPDIDQRTIYVNFSDYNDSSLGIFCYYYTRPTVWGEHLNVKERINLEFMRIVRKNGASFAFPSQSIYIEKNSAKNTDI